jgi:hypothetical protein
MVAVRKDQRAVPARWLTGEYSGGMWLPQNKTMKISRGNQPDKQETNIVAVDSRNHRREKFRVATGLRCVLKLVPKAHRKLARHKVSGLASRQKKTRPERTAETFE